MTVIYSVCLIMLITYICFHKVKNVHGPRCQIGGQTARQRTSSIVVITGHYLPQFQNLNLNLTKIKRSCSFPLLSLIPFSLSLSLSLGSFVHGLMEDREQNDTVACVNGLYYVIMRILFKQITILLALP